MSKAESRSSVIPRSLLIRLEGFSQAKEKMIELALAALQGVGYDTQIVKLLERVDLPAGHGGMTLFTLSGAALGPEAFSSQPMLNYVLEEELLHLVQMAEGKTQVFGPETARELEDAVHEARKFHRPP